jgi:hypothetical protein
LRNNIQELQNDLVKLIPSGAHGDAKARSAIVQDVLVQREDEVFFYYLDLI